MRNKNKKATKRAHADHALVHPVLDPNLRKVYMEVAKENPLKFPSMRIKKRTPKKGGEQHGI